MKTKVLHHSFVKFIPEVLDEGILYISMEYGTAMHRCACGCGNPVVTPFSPTDWQLYFNGEAISLSPSIGNWNFTCQSHYWIRQGQIQWAGKWSKDEIEKGRKRDQINKGRHVAKPDNPIAELPKVVEEVVKPTPSGWRYLLDRFWNWLK